ncbi:hypothetical protein P1O94_004905, partial [Escherichia coli]|nr:hypothetical protein [Escherichia coli]
KGVIAPGEYFVSVAVNNNKISNGQKINWQKKGDCIDSLEVRKKPGGHWIIRDLMGLDLVGLASL